MVRFLVVLILYFLLATDAVQVGRFSSLRLPNALPTSLNKYKGHVDDYATRVKKNLVRFKKGSLSLIPSLIEAWKLKRLRKTKGDAALTYSEFLRLESSNEDWKKLFQMGMSLTFSSQYFIFNSIVWPIFSTNVFVWDSFPSSFSSDPSDQEVITKVHQQRRTDTVYSILAALQRSASDALSVPGASIADVPPVQKQHLDVVQKVLESADKDQAVDILTPWLMGPKQRSPSVTIPSSVPREVVKDLVRCIGGDGYPALPLLTSFNVGALSKYVSKIRSEDSFLSATSVDKLSKAELELACHHRFIPSEGQGEAVLRGQLTAWLRRATTPPPATTSSRTSGHWEVNTHNKYLALMGLEAVDACRRTSNQSVMNSLVKPVAVPAARKESNLQN